MHNTMVQKSEFSKMRDCSGFLQIGSHILIPEHQAVRMDCDIYHLRTSQLIVLTINTIMKHLDDLVTFK